MIWPVRVTLFSLLSGVLLSVGIAWYQATAGPVPRHGTKFIAARTDSGKIRQFVLMSTASRLGQEAIAFTGTDSAAWHRHGLRVQEEIPETPRWAPWPHDVAFRQTKLYVACGWPAKCLVAKCVEQDERWQLSVKERLARGVPPAQFQQLPPAIQAQLTPRFVKSPPQWTEAIVLKDQQINGPFTAAVLPYGIIPLGLMANTLLNGMLVAAFIVGGITVLRRIRVARGCCPRCFL